MIHFVCLIFNNYLLNPLPFFFFLFLTFDLAFSSHLHYLELLSVFLLKRCPLFQLNFILNLGIPDVNITLSPTSHILAKICKAHSKCLEPINLKPLFYFLFFFILLLLLLLLLLLPTSPTILSIMVP